MKDLGDRMKRYEDVTRHHLTARVPVIIRLDGKAFHTLTRGMNKPFDMQLIDAMICSARIVCEKIQGFKLAYVQSDEVSILVTDLEKVNTQGWFLYNLSKMVSISAAMMSVHFTNLMGMNGFFDSRAFNIPRYDVSNYFLWRAKDWTRNSLSMYARAFFSHKELMNKHSSDVHEMLHSIGKNWTKDLPNICKNGTWILPDKTFSHDNYSSYQDIENLIIKCESNKD